MNLGLVGDLITWFNPPKPPNEFFINIRNPNSLPWSLEQESYTWDIKEKSSICECQILKRKIGYLEWGSFKERLPVEGNLVSCTLVIHNINQVSFLPPHMVFWLHVLCYDYVIVSHFITLYHIIIYFVEALFINVACLKWRGYKGIKDKKETYTYWEGDHLAWGRSSIPLSLRMKFVN